MLYAVIITSEVLFWVFLLAGLTARYPLRSPRLGAALLVCAPLVDLITLAAAVIDLRGGAEPSFDTSSRRSTSGCRSASVTR